MCVAVFSSASNYMQRFLGSNSAGVGLFALVTALSAAGCDKEPAASDLSSAIPTPAQTSPSLAPRLADSDALLVEKGKVVVREAFSLLSSNLLVAIAGGGPTNAIPFCSVKALPLTETISQAHSVELRRVSARQRNLKNAPSKQEQAILQEFQNALENGEKPSPKVVRGQNEAFFYAPIQINTPLCLACHGDPGKDLAAETSEVLRGLYPDDQATGYKLGDLRGMWVVRVTAPR